MAQQDAKITTNHDTIRKWVESRNGAPATVKSTEKRGEEAGLLRIDFDYNGPEENLNKIDWDSFFDKFEEKNLAFLYQDKTKDGSQSTFFKFIDRNSDQAKDVR